MAIGKSPADQLEQLSITPPSNSSEDFSLTVTATSTEENGETRSVTESIRVDVASVADAADLSVESLRGLVGQRIPFEIDASLTDLDGSENLTIIVRGLPDSASLSEGSRDSDGNWHLNSDQLDELQLQLPYDNAGDFSIEVAAVSTDEDGDVHEVTQTLELKIDAPPVEDESPTDPERSDGPTNSFMPNPEDESVRTQENFDQQLEDTTDLVDRAIDNAPNPQRLEVPSGDSLELEPTQTEFVVNLGDRETTDWSQVELGEVEQVDGEPVDAETEFNLNDLESRFNQEDTTAAPELETATQASKGWMPWLWGIARSYGGVHQESNRDEQR